MKYRLPWQEIWTVCLIELFTFLCAPCPLNYTIVLSNRLLHEWNTFKTKTEVHEVVSISDLKHPIWNQYTTSYMFCCKFLFIGLIHSNKYQQIVCDFAYIWGGFEELFLGRFLDLCLMYSFLSRFSFCQSHLKHHTYLIVELSSRSSSFAVQLS